MWGCSITQLARLPLWQALQLLINIILKSVSFFDEQAGQQAKVLQLSKVCMPVEKTTWTISCLAMAHIRRTGGKARNVMNRRKVPASVIEWQRPKCNQRTKELRPGQLWPSTRKTSVHKLKPTARLTQCLSTGPWASWQEQFYVVTGPPRHQQPCSWQPPQLLWQP